MSIVMWHHFVNLLSQSRNNFLFALGTTGLGWWVQGIIWFSATEVATFLVIWVVQGKSAMRTHVAEKFWLGVYVWLIVMVCVYVPIFGWYGVKAVYDDHQTLVAINSKLVDPKSRDEEIKRLTKLLEAAGKKPQAPTGLEIACNGIALDGQTLSVTTRNSTVDGKPMFPVQENFSLPEFRIRNIDSHVTTAVSLQIYLSKQIQSGAWVSLASDESGFPSSFYTPITVGGLNPSQIEAQQTVSVGFWGSAPGPWTSADIITAKLKIFYGAKKPAIANFRIRKSGVAQ